ncbi:nuclease HARBI1-like protein, partial [Aphelenchoides avenae]
AEQAFGILKARFRVLHGEWRLQPPKLCKVATACAILHNMATDDRIEVEPLVGDSDEKQEPAPEAYVQNIAERMTT